MARTTTPITLESWLATATFGLCDEAVGRIRDEIIDHYHAALAAGQTPEEAIASLGDPKKACQQYWKIFLTVDEASDAPVLGSFRAELLDCIQRVFVILFLGVASSFLDHLGSANPWILLPVASVHLVFHLFFPATNATRARNYFFGGLAQTVVIAYLIGPVYFLVLSIFLLPEHLRAYVRWKTCRKLETTPLPVLQAAIAAHANHLGVFEEKLFLQWERQAFPGPWTAVLVLLLACCALFAWIRPWSGVPFALFMAFTFGLPYFVRIDTSARGQSFRRIKWILFAAAVVFPIVSLLWAPLSLYGFLNMHLMVYFVLSSILWVESFREALRRKLPVDQWPERLYR